MQRFRFGFLSWSMAIWYVVLCAAVLAFVLHEAPHFSYSLDDPYIHLALAQGILHGTYGINPGETVSPSSSVIWPFLLVPFADSAVREWVPLFLNMLCCFGTCCVLGSYLEPRLRRTGFSSFGLVVMGLLLVGTASMLPLTFAGMEHSLQVLTVSLIAVGCALAWEGEPIPMLCVVGAALSPSVRYDDLGFTLAFCAAIWLRGGKKTAVTTFAASLVPIILLGLYLKMHGLSFLPNSVRVKGYVASSTAASDGTFAKIYGMAALAFLNLRNSVVPSVGQHSRLIVTAFFLGIAVMLWRDRRSRRRLVLVPALLLILVTVAMSPYMFRYDVGIRVFLFVLTTGLLLALLPRIRIAVWACAAVAFLGYLSPLVYAADACVMIARQQYEMHRFLAEYARTNVAVNDLGWAVMDSHGSYYVLDLVGLGSNEAAGTPTPRRNAAWLQGIAAEHSIQLVMIYPEWFKGVPAGWTKLGVLSQDRVHFHGYVGVDTVTFYATSAEAANVLRPKLSAFVASLPPQVHFKDVSN